VGESGIYGVKLFVHLTRLVNDVVLGESWHGRLAQALCG